MPWIDQESCNGCGICVDECPVDTISLRDGTAVIDMENCIRCGVCHDVCPQESVRHDSEKIPEEIEANVRMTQRFMDSCAEHLGREQEKERCLKRMKKHFNRQRIVAEKTLSELSKL